MWQSCKSGQWSENNSNLKESLHTRSKTVTLVNSHKLTLTSLIKLMKHVMIIMIACIPSKEETNGLGLNETGYTSLHLTCGKIVSLVNGANRLDKPTSNT